MKTMRNRSALALSLAVALALVASVLAATPASAQLLQEILKKGTVRVGVPIDVAPFGFTDSDGKPAGFDVDMANWPRTWGSSWSSSRSPGSTASRTY